MDKKYPPPEALYAECRRLQAEKSKFKLKIQY
jgi:hypothetical protein